MARLDGGVVRLERATAWPGGGPAWPDRAWPGGAVAWPGGGVLRLCG
ncbi:hypothetical protein [Nonomuraea antimicrobica]